MIRSSRMLFLLIIFCAGINVLAQVPDYIQAYRNDSAGTVNALREATFGGNNVRSLFYNNAEIARWKLMPSGEWPMGSGHSYLDGYTLLVAAEVTAPGNNQVFHTVVTSYHEYYDKDTISGLQWGFAPIPGYYNYSHGQIAISTDPASWPAVWPAAINRSSFDGHWLGFFGRDVFYPSFETFFVMDDSKDYEFTQSPYKFFPILSDTTRGGLGTRVETRIMQWQGKTIEDAAYILYQIFNISDFDYAKTCYGLYIDPGVGGPDDSQDDVAKGNKFEDMVYMYDYNGHGSPVNWKTGYMGCVLLQTPSDATNGIDDDDDGMIDEKQDDGIDNDHDWNALTDDVGMDGIAGTHDQGEGDGVPTLGEPNFDYLDFHEADMLGLTSLSIYRMVGGGTGGGWPKDDESMWLKMKSGFTDTSIQNANVAVVMATGPFLSEKWKTNRFTSALLFGDTLAALRLTKSFSQKFYESNFNASLISGTGNDHTATAPDFDLYDNYPNPFNPSTTISFSLAQSGPVSLRIYDTRGAEVRILVNEAMSQGKHTVTFDAGSLASGVYFYKLRSGEQAMSKKMILVK